MLILAEHHQTTPKGWVLNQKRILIISPTHSSHINQDFKLVDDDDCINIKTILFCLHSEVSCKKIDNLPEINDADDPVYVNVKVKFIM